MKLTELVAELERSGISVVGSWEIDGEHGVYLGDPKQCFPKPGGDLYSVNCADSSDNNPDLLQTEVDAIRRRFAKQIKAAQK